MIPATLDHNLLYSGVGLACKSHCHNGKSLITPEVYGHIYRDYFLCSLV